jgi:hypothetical protein
MIFYCAKLQLSPVISIKQNKAWCQSDIQWYYSLLNFIKILLTGSEADWDRYTDSKVISFAFFPL